MDYYTQFDILSVFYVDGQLATHQGAQNYTVNENFQICQLNVRNVGRRDDDIRRNFEDTTPFQSIAHESTRIHLADFRYTNDYYARNPQAIGLIEIKSNTLVREALRNYRNNFGQDTRMLVLFQFFYVTKQESEE